MSVKQKFEGLAWFLITLFSFPVTVVVAELLTN